MRISIVSSHVGWAFISVASTREEGWHFDGENKGRGGNIIQRKNLATCIIYSCRKEKRPFGKLRYLTLCSRGIIRHGWKCERLFGHVVLSGVLQEPLRMVLGQPCILVDVWSRPFLRSSNFSSSSFRFFGNLFSYFSFLYFLHLSICLFVYSFFFDTFLISFFNFFYCHLSLSSWGLLKCSI